MSNLKSGLIIALVVIGLLVAAVFVGRAIGFGQGRTVGANETTDIFVGRIDSLNQWYATHPPSPETTTVYVEKPPLVRVDTLKVIDSLHFKPDSLVVARYPYAIWQVAYNSLNGGLTVITYNTEKRFENRIGSFAIEGDDQFDFSSSPWEPPKKPVAIKTPFLYTNLSMDVAATPDYASFGSKFFKDYVGTATFDLDYALVIAQRFDVSVFAGLGYNKWNPTPWYPEAGLQVSFLIMGRH